MKIYFPKGQLIKTRLVIFRNNQFISKHTFHIQNPSKYLLRMLICSSVWDMSQYNKLSDFQYARFQILAVHFDFGLFWSGGIPTMYNTCYFTILQHTCISHSNKGTCKHLFLFVTALLKVRVKTTICKSYV